MILHSDREGNDCIRKLQCHCIQILHSDIYSVASVFVIVLHLKCKKNLPTAFGLALFYFSGNIFFETFEIRNTSFSRNVPYFCQLPA